MHRFPSGKELELEFSCCSLQIGCNCSNPRAFFKIKVKDKAYAAILKCIYQGLAVGNRDHCNYFKQENQGSENRKVGCRPDFQTWLQVYLAGLSFNGAVLSILVRRWEWPMTLGVLEHWPRPRRLGTTSVIIVSLDTWNQWPYMHRTWLQYMLGLLTTVPRLKKVGSLSYSHFQ